MLENLIYWLSGGTIILALFLSTFCWVVFGASLVVYLILGGWYKLKGFL